MSVNRLLTQPLTLYPASVTLDDYHNEVRGLGDPVPVKGLLQQLSSVEYLTDRDTTVTQWTVFLPAGTAVDPQSRVEYLGQMFEVTGAPEQVWNPRLARVTHIEAKLTEVS